MFTNVCSYFEKLFCNIICAVTLQFSIFVCPSHYLSYALTRYTCARLNSIWGLATWRDSNLKHDIETFDIFSKIFIKTSMKISLREEGHRWIQTIWIQSDWRKKWVKEYICIIPIIWEEYAKKNQTSVLIRDRENRVSP